MSLKEFFVYRQSGWSRAISASVNIQVNVVKGSSINQDAEFKIFEDKNDGKLYGKR